MDTPPFDALLGYLGQSEDHNWTQYICEHVAKGVLRRFEAHDWQRPAEDDRSAARVLAATLHRRAG